MAPFRDFSSWNIRSSESDEPILPYRRYYLICEGANTENFYFKKLVDERKLLGIHPMIDVVYVERTGEDIHMSAPVKLFECAELKKKEQIDKGVFDEERDKFIVVFDYDVFKNKAKNYQDLLKIADERGYILGVTNPNFELFLVLHIKGSVDDIIIPDYEKILENKKDGGKRYITKVFSNLSGINPKTNKNVAEFVYKVDVAIEQEKMINENIRNCHNYITCNIGRIIESLKNAE